ncbi:type B chloramphenicol O-acetyltransferase, partial [Bacillus sp. SIMBA_154]
LVMPGVEIGTGAVVGAGSVVTKDVDPYNIVVGVPARVLKKRFGEETISRLNEARVYERDSDKSLKLFHRYYSLDIEQVLDEFIDELSHIEFR